MDNLVEIYRGKNIYYSNNNYYIYYWDEINRCKYPAFYDTIEEMRKEIDWAIENKRI